MSAGDYIELGTIFIVTGALLLVSIPTLIHFLFKKMSL